MKFSSLLVFTFLFFASTAQVKKIININELTLECIKTNGEIPNRQMALWLPVDFWQIIGDKMKISPSSVTRIVDEMSNYLTFAIVDYTIGSPSPSFKTEDDIRRYLKFIDSSKKVFYPLAENEISTEANKMLEILKPTIARLLGEFGEGMHLFMFKANKVKGKQVIDISKSYNFTIVWQDIKMKWELPFASTLIPKHCPVDNELMKGNWNYCPIHGKMLN
jgi:hypothetical protein